MFAWRREIMTLPIILSAELEHRLRREAERRGEALATVALQLLDQHLPPLEEIDRRLDAATNLEELFAAADAAPEPEDGYDLLNALEGNRKGERPLFPPELKGISW
jgi:hypothetical protein